MIVRASMRIFYPQGSYAPFIEHDGMVLLRRGDVAESSERFRESGLLHSRWRFERGENHVHASMSVVDREHVRQELAIAVDFTATLQTTFPERRFIITHIPKYAVSFHSILDDAPVEAGVFPLPRPLDREGRAWCQHCQGARPYVAQPFPDPEFGFVDWGRCVECRNDLILNPNVEIRTPIGPANSDGKIARLR